MSSDLGILVLRVLFGAVVAAHGSQKLFGAFGGYGLRGTGAFFESLGFRPGKRFAALAGSSELVGGLLLSLGLFTPAAATLILATMLVAMASVHLTNGFFATNNGIELPFLVAAATLGILFTGGGAFSFDSWLGFGFLNQPYVAGTGLAAAFLGAGVNLAMRQPDRPAVVAAVGQQVGHS